MRETREVTSSPLVNIVDDDVSMRESLTDLFRSISYEVSAFDSPDEFLRRSDLTRPGCIVLDVRLPGINGIEFKAQLERNGSVLPVVFMTGFGDISMSVRAMKSGAVDFLAKPFRDQEIIDAVMAAIGRDAARRHDLQHHKALAARVELLTPREREVMDAVAQGLMNKQIAFNLGISEVTVKLHRGNVMRKLEVRSVAQLVRMTDRTHDASPRA